VIVTVDVRISVPVADVFDAMADARNEPRWNTQVSECELLTGEPIARGTHFRTVNRGQAYSATITEYDRPDRVTFVVAGKALEITGALQFVNDGGSTHMTGAFDLQPKGFMKVMLPLMAAAVRKDFPRQMANFKQFCESMSKP
jgi:uncharacterized protein YndB with AHSA1/START domain